MEAAKKRMLAAHKADLRKIHVNQWRIGASLAVQASLMLAASIAVRRSGSPPWVPYLFLAVGAFFYVPQVKCLYLGSRLSRTLKRLVRQLES